MKTILLISTILIAVTIFGISKSYAQYGDGFSPVQHYPTTNDTKLKLVVMNSTEFKERTTGHNYAFAGIDYNWISKGNNNFDFGGARVTFLVSGFENGTTKGYAFNLGSQMNVKSVFEYDADRPPAGYRSDTCYGCLLPHASQPDVDKFHIGHVADSTYNETAALQRATQLMNMQNEKLAEKQNLEVQLAIKQHDYDDAIKNSDSTKISSLLGDINQIKNQTSNLQVQIDKITQELNVIQEANIQFYYMDPVLFKKYQAAADGFSTKIQVQYWKGKSFDEQKNAFPLVGAGVDSKKKSVEITLWKGIENSTTVDRYISVIKELMSPDIPWYVDFGEYATAYSTVKIQSPLKQFKSGIPAADVTCSENYVLTIKSIDGSPVCVKLDTKVQLLKRGWAKPGPKDFGYNPGRGPLTFHDPQSNGMDYHGLPTSPDIKILYNGTQSSRDVPFYVKQGQNATLIVDVTSDPVHIPVTLYAEPHIGFTKTNGIDLKLSDTVVNTPAKVVLYMSISKDATPNTYQTLVKANTTGMGLDDHFFVAVK